MNFANFKVRIPLFVYCGLIFSNSVFAAVVLDQLSIREPKAPTNISRARIGVDLVVYEKLMIKDRTGSVKANFRKAPVIRNNIRARIDSTNHFYVNDWHIETIPVSYKADSKNLRIRVRFYKRYGSHKSLEEVVGTTEVVGNLEGDKTLYNFKGSQTAKFFNAANEPLLDVSIYEPSPIKEGLGATVEKEEKVKVKDSF